MDRDQSSNPQAAGDRAPGYGPPGDAAAQPSRRQLLYGAGAGLGLAALAPVLRPGGHLRAGAAAGGTRVTARAAADRSRDLGQDWKFVLVNPNGTNDPTGAYTNAYQPGFDDSGWQAVDVPHDWAIYLTPVDLPGTSSGTGFLQTGTVPAAMLDGDLSTGGRTTTTRRRRPTCAR